MYRDERYTLFRENYAIFFRFEYRVYYSLIGFEKCSTL